MGQTLVVLAIVLFAFGYLGLRLYRTARSATDASSGCASGCGCGDSPARSSTSV